VTDLRALIVDFGGVLTSSLTGSMGEWAEAEQIDTAELRTVMKDWLGTSYGDDAAVNPIHALERGEVELPDFERELASRLRTVDGHPVEPEGLLARMFQGFEMQTPVSDAVKHAKRAGFATALLSNSWGNDYPRDGWEDMFDVVVISGEVGMRKPDREIFELTADKLGLPPGQCVFVDDLLPNVTAAVEVGMTGVHHISQHQTVEELEALLETPLRG
jgi:epoxide hydrolase-like predicted phosphatase